MAKLPEGVTQKRTEYGSTEYFYKGVKLSKFQQAYRLRYEYLIWQTGKFSYDYSSGAYSLREIPALVEGFLNNSDYFLENGFFKLTSYAKENKIEKLKADIRRQFSDTENKIAELVNLRDWERVAESARHLADYASRNEWALESETIGA